MTSSTRLMKGGLKAAACVFLSLLASACAWPVPQQGDDGLNMDVLKITPPDYHGSPGHPLEESCRNWTWSAAQIQTFFQLSDVYPEAPHSGFYQVGCGVSGKLRADGRTWTFAINGGGMATWQDGATIRHFGCSAPGCDSLLLMPYDGMEPD